MCVKCRKDFALLPGRSGNARLNCYSCSPAKLSSNAAVSSAGRRPRSVEPLERSIRPRNDATPDPQQLAQMIVREVQAQVREEMLKLATVLRDKLSQREAHISALSASRLDPQLVHASAAKVQARVGGPKREHLKYATRCIHVNDP